MPIFYTTGIPAANQYQDEEQPFLQQNTNAVNELVAVNHVTFNQTDFGKHNFVQYVNQASDPASDLTGMTGFVKNDNNAVPQLFIREPNSGTIQQTTTNVVLPTVAPWCGQSIIYGGILVKFGIIPIATSDTPFMFGVGVLNTLTVFPSACFGVNLTPNTNVSSSASATAFSITGSGFTAKANTSTSYFFVAYGK
ncbi:MAG: hypothetical protein ACYC0F_18420 [Rhodanobacter sp.]